MPTAVKDFYYVLRVHPKASDDEIKTAYHAVAKRCHPDKHADNFAEMNARMVEINAAWELLGNPQRRAAYDAEYAAFMGGGEPHSGAAPEQEPQFGDLYSAYINAMLSEDYETAALLAEELAGRFPDIPQSHIARGHAYYEQGAWARANASYKRARLLDQSLIEEFAGQWLTCMQRLDRGGEAVRIAEDLHGEQPDNLYFSFLLAATYYDCGRYQQAIDIGQEVVKWAELAALEEEADTRNSAIVGELKQTVAYAYFKQAEALWDDLEKRERRVTGIVAVTWHELLVMLNAGAFMRDLNYTRQLVLRALTFIPDDTDALELLNSLESQVRSMRGKSALSLGFRVLILLPLMIGLWIIGMALSIAFSGSRRG